MNILDILSWLFIPREKTVPETAKIFVQVPEPETPEQDPETLFLHPKTVSRVMDAIQLKNQTRLMAAFHRALETEGWQLVYLIKNQGNYIFLDYEGQPMRGELFPSNCKYQLQEAVLPDIVMLRVADSLMQTHNTFLMTVMNTECPGLPHGSMSPDRAIMWISLIMEGFRAAGWFPFKTYAYTPSTKWEANRYPLRQVMIKTGPLAGVPLSSVSSFLMQRCMDIATETGLSAHTLEGEWHTPGKAGFRYTIEYTQCLYAPGWFPDPAGYRFPPVLLWDKRSQSELYADGLTIFLQATRLTEGDVLGGFLSYIIDALVSGRTRGADCDDDTGYAFMLGQPDTSELPD